MRLRERWLRHTMEKAYIKAERDRLLFGTGYIIRSWWGWSCVSVEAVIRITTNNSAATKKELSKFLNL